MKTNVRVHSTAEKVTAVTELLLGLWAMATVTNTAQLLFTVRFMGYSRTASSIISIISF